jgi:two-component system chemotaxis sensor kinase CheA
MKGIDAILVMKKIEDIAEIIDSSPSFNEIEDGKFEMFELRLKGSVDEVNNILSKLPQVQEFDFEAKKHSKEQKKEQIEKESGERGDESRKAEVFTEKIQSIRISVHKLDELMNLVEELVIRRLKLENSLPEEVKREIGGEFSAFDRIIARLQDTVMDLRLIPLKHIVDRLPRMVRDLCKSLGKEVDFKIEGSDVTVDRNAIDKIQDPLIHMVRNAIDHGIEPPDVRERTGKNRTGKVILRASKLKDHVLIEVSDDGKGLDPKEIKDKAVEMGVIPREKAEELSEEELYNIILLPGFSTAKKVTDISGRGVGTDIIVNTVKSLGGSVEVKSEKGKGTTFKLRLPLTMAISQVLLVKVGGEKYGIPIRDIIEVKPINACEIRNVGGMDRLIARDKIVPLIHLNKALGIDSNSNGEKMVVVVSSLEKILALACDSVLAQKEVVVKSLGMLRSVKGISGISILGEGEVVPILDVNTLQEVSV